MCTTMPPSNTITKFADDTMVVGLITGVMNQPKGWKYRCWQGGRGIKNNLELNTTKTKVMVIDFRRQRRPCSTLHKWRTCSESSRLQVLGDPHCSLLISFVCSGPPVSWCFLVVLLSIGLAMCLCDDILSQCLCFQCLWLLFGVVLLFSFSLYYFV